MHTIPYSCALFYCHGFSIVQVFEFPLNYGLCTCSPPREPSCSAIELCGTTVVQNLLSNADIPSNSAATLDTSVMDNIAYTFNGAHTSENWVLVSDEAKTNFFELVDNQDFTVTCWLRVDSESRAAYIFSFQTGNGRYFSLYEVSKQRAIFYYFRDRIAEPEDSGYETQVALSFYYDTDIFPDGLRDDEWHFIALSVDYPSITLTIDGYNLRPTQGNYYSVSNQQILLGQLTDGTYYEMPAEILRKTEAQIDNINGYIGGSSRGNSYSLDGAIRQLILTDYLDTDAYSCLGACDVTIYSDGSVSDFSTFFNPAKRSFEFSTSAEPNEPIGDAEYTEYMGTLLFSDNGFLQPEQQEESWMVSVQVRNYYVLAKRREGFEYLQNGFLL